MRKLFASALLGLAALGLAAGPASAGWLFNHCCSHKCCLKLCAKQYNAFSPYCLDSLNGCLPLQGCAGNGGCYLGCPQGCSAYAGVACLGELPAPGVADGATALHGQIAPPANGAPTGSGSVTIQNGNPAVLVPGTTAPPWQGWPGFASPNAVPLPTGNGFGQSNGLGR